MKNWSTNRCNKNRYNKNRYNKSGNRITTLKIRILVLVIGLLGIVSSIEYYSITNSEKKDLSIIFIPKIIDDKNDFWTALIAGVKMAAQEHNVRLQIVAPNKEEEYQQQNALIEWAIDQKPDAIMLAPCDYTQTTRVAQKVKENEIALIFIDSDVDKPLCDTIVATDNFIAGNKMGRLAREYISKDTKIGIVGHVQASSTSMERIRGIEYGLGDGKNQIVDTVFCDSSFDKAYDATVKMLGEHPDISFIFGTNEYAAVGSANAIKDMGLAGKVKMIGFDNSLEEVQLLEEGVFVAIVIQKPFNMGYLGVEQALHVIRGEKHTKSVDSGSETITTENIYTRENQKLLFPFVGSQYQE